MSNDRKSFLLHFDSLGVLDKLTKEQAADLFIACRDYNLGKEIHLDAVMELVFFSFKTQFDRDIEKYKNIVERNKNNGSKGGRPNNPIKARKPTGLSRSPKKPKKADSDSDSDNKNDSGSDSDNKNIKNDKAVSQKLDFSCWPSEPDKQVFNDWLAMRKKLKASVSQTVINRLAKEIKIADSNGVSVNDVLSECVLRNWRGFEYEWISNKVVKFDVHNLDNKHYRTGDL